jgi:hypothetical protein
LILQAFGKSCAKELGDSVVFGIEIIGIVVLGGGGLGEGRG